MAPFITLKLANRQRKPPVKRLPPSVDIPNEATIEDVKIAIAKKAGVGDYNRIGIFDPETSKIFSDRKALVNAQSNVVSSKALLVQDLGPQFAWRTVYLVEYFGPILFHALFVWIRPYLNIPWFYENTDKTPLTDVQWLLFWLFQLHFLKREFETAFVHRFAANTMPAWNIFRNSAFYWGEAGLLCALSIYATWSPARFPAEPRSGVTTLDYVLVALWVVFQACNAIVHVHLVSLRPKNSTAKGIPSCIGSSLVTCPNYMFEVLGWLMVILISRDVTVVIFILTGIMYMASWSRDKEKALRRLFPDEYKKKKYTMLPGLI